MGFNTGKIVSKKDGGRQKFQIVSTSPAPYSSVRRGETINLLVSSGSDDGSATSADLKMFEIFTGAEIAKVPVAEKTPAPAASVPVANQAPKIILPSENSVTVAQPVLTQPVKAPVAAAEKEMSFVMPDGFMPKEVKFIHITSDGRQQVYSATHKPLDLVKVKVPVVPNSKVQIYINDVPIEERKVEP
jgi:hypothetical protein